MCRSCLAALRTLSLLFLAEGSRYEKCIKQIVLLISDTPDTQNGRVTTVKPTPGGTALSGDIFQAGFMMDISKGLLIYRIYKALNHSYSLQGL